MTRDELIDLLVEDFIHVVGYSGAGKTTLMKELKSSFPKLQVFDADTWQARRYKQIQTGEYSPTKQLKVDSLTRSDLRAFAKRFEDNKQKHGLVVGIHFIRGPKKWQKYQLNTGSLRSTYRMLKRDKGNRFELKAYTDMMYDNKFDKAKYQSLGYTPISKRQLRAKVASLYKK
jgi:GTPase SAR1 family protein